MDDFEGCPNLSVRQIPEFITCDATKFLNRVDSNDQSRFVGKDSAYVDSTCRDSEFIIG